MSCVKASNIRLFAEKQFDMYYLYVRFAGTHREYDAFDCSTI
ncbi:MAG: hypothetical protein GXY09_00750 [Bacteroidales bacterium]|nr:hypothetical protein [Bacteroidales bacterium]